MKNTYKSYSYIDIKADACLLRLFFALSCLLCLSACNTANINNSSDEEQSVVENISAEGALDLSRIESYAEYDYLKRDWDSAEKNYLLLLKEQPNNSIYWYRLGNVYSYSNRSEQAINAYRQAIIRDQDNIKAWNNLAMTQLKQATVTLLNLQTKLDASDPNYNQINTIVEKIQHLMSNETDSP